MKELNTRQSIHLSTALANACGTLVVYAQEFVFYLYLFSTCPNHVVSCDRFHGGVNYNLLKGTLVGGPDINDTYADNREDYNGNQVGLDYNAGFHGALAGNFQLLLFSTKILRNCNKPIVLCISMMQKFWQSISLPLLKISTSNME